MAPPETKNAYNLLQTETVHNDLTRLQADCSGFTVF